MVGARLNWLLSHGKGKSWGEPGSKRFIQVDIEPREMDSNVEIAAPVVGDIGSCLSAMTKAMGDKWPACSCRLDCQYPDAQRCESGKNVSQADEQYSANGFP
jgi:oxalyl-CoA decarboxylase